MNDRVKASPLSGGGRAQGPVSLPRALSPCSSNDRFQRSLGLAPRGSLLLQAPRADTALAADHGKPYDAPESETASRPAAVVSAGSCDLPHADGKKPGQWLPPELQGDSPRHDKAMPEFRLAVKLSTPQHWTSVLAGQIVEMFAEADARFTEWSIQLALDPEVLPSSSLRLNCSPHRLSLRFMTQSAQACQLILDHGQSLVQQLQQCVSLPADIDIECT